MNHRVHRVFLSPAPSQQPPLRARSIVRASPAGGVAASTVRTGADYQGRDRAGIQPMSVRIVTRTTDPQPWSRTARGGKTRQRITRPQLIANSVRHQPLYCFRRSRFPAAAFLRQFRVTVRAAAAIVAPSPVAARARSAGMRFSPAADSAQSLRRTVWCAWPSWPPGSRGGWQSAGSRRPAAADTQSA